MGAFGLLAIIRLLFRHPLLTGTFVVLALAATAIALRMPTLYKIDRPFLDEDSEDKPMSTAGFLVLMLIGIALAGGVIYALTLHPTTMETPSSADRDIARYR